MEQPKHTSVRGKWSTLTSALQLKEDIQCRGPYRQQQPNITVYDL